MSRQIPEVAASRAGARALALCGALACTVTSAAPASVDVEAGRSLYEYYCYQCHGYAGNGDTLAAQFLRPPPRDFTRLKRAERSRDAMLHSVRHGRPGTGMQSFSRVLDDRQSAAVVDYIRTTFMDGGKVKTGYHTPANGWPGHARHAAAFPFATGVLALDAKALSPEQEAGKRLFLASCISCHEGRVQEAAPVWAERVVSFPRNAGTCSPCHANAVKGPRPADALHVGALGTTALTPMQMRGRQLFVTHCAFCHDEDGSGRNWIGTFLEPHARDLTQASLRGRLTPERLRRTILDGLPGTAMPAWRTVLAPGDVEALMDFLSMRYQWTRANMTRSATNALDIDTRTQSQTGALSWRRRTP